MHATDTIGGIRD